MGEIVILRGQDQGFSLLCEKYASACKASGIKFIDALDEGIDSVHSGAYVIDKMPFLSDEAQRIREELRRRGCKPLNSIDFGAICLDKHRSMIFLEGCGVNVPKTWLFSMERLKSLLDERGSAYLKPRCLSKGDGVIKVRNVSDCSRMLPNKEYILQEEIVPKSLDSRPYDFRALIQRCAGSRLAVQCIYCRIGAVGTDVSNIDKGGRVEDANKVLGLLYPGNSDNIRKAIETEALRAAEALACKYSFFEAGVDIMLDLRGKPFVIEVNSNPAYKGLAILSGHSEDSAYGLGKISYDELSRSQWQDIYRRVIEAPIAFAAKGIGKEVMLSCAA